MEAIDRDAREVNVMIIPAVYQPRHCHYSHHHKDQHVNTKKVRIVVGVVVVVVVVVVSAVVVISVAVGVVVVVVVGVWLRRVRELGGLTGASQCRSIGENGLDLTSIRFSNFLTG